MSRSLIVSLLLAALAIAAFWGVQGHGFITLDDQGYLVENPQVRAGLTWGGLRWALTATYAANWHPLTWISHMLDVQLFGMDAGAHHAVNLAFHAANAVLLFLVLTRLSGALWRSALVAAMFCVHPLHVESVAWVSERKDVLSTCFGLLALGGYLAQVRRPGRGALVAALAAYALGLMAKPMLVTLPFLLLLLDWWPLARWGPGAATRAPARGRGVGLFPPFSLWREKAPFFALAALSSWITFRAQSGVGATASWGSLPWEVRLANAAMSVVGYLGKTLWPVDLSVFYPHPAAIPAWPTLGWNLLVLGALTFAALRSSARRPWRAAGWLWYLGTLVPVVGLVQVGSQAMADRYTYVPLVGIFLAVAWESGELLARRPALRPAAVLAALALIAALAAGARRQSAHWQDSGTLFRHARDLDPANYVAHFHLGLLSVAQGDLDAAVGSYREALRSKPDYAEANFQLAELLAARGRVEEAVGLYGAALRIEPRAAGIHNNLGVALIRLGDLEGAATAFQQALRADPGHATARFNHGKVQRMRGRVGEAAVEFRALVESDPGDVESLLELGDAYVLLERPQDARAAYLRALETDPSLTGSPLCVERGSPWCGLVAAGGP